MCEFNYVKIIDEIYYLFKYNIQIYKKNDKNLEK